MTKVTILGQEPKEEKKNKINLEFILGEKEMIKCSYKASDWKHVELVCFKYGRSDKDLMFCYNDNRNEGGLYLGHFNDGIV